MAISTRDPVRSEWKISEVLARYPQLLTVLIDLSPAFRHLRNPLARTLRTRLVSVAQAARVAGMGPNELVRCLNQAVGIEVPEQEDGTVEKRAQNAAAADVEITEELDVRPLLERGEEPFTVIMAAIARLPESGALRLRSSFEPVPLYAVLARRGFSHRSHALASDDWEIIFSRVPHDEVPLARCAGANCEPPGSRPASVSEAEEVVHLDVSDLVPPEPMVRILETAARLELGQTLVVEHHRRPVYLYPQLDAQGFVHETNEIGPGRVQIRIRRA
jgi:uncharacterized protein (DUF2249 family)